MSDSYEPGVYVKGDQSRVCQTKSDAVHAVFDGFKLQAADEQVEQDVPEDAPTTTATPDSASALETSVDPAPGEPGSGAKRGGKPSPSIFA